MDVPIKAAFSNQKSADFTATASSGLGRPRLWPGRHPLHWLVDIRCPVHLGCPTTASTRTGHQAKVTEFVQFDISDQAKSPAVYGTEEGEEAL